MKPVSLLRLCHPAAALLLMVTACSDGTRHPGGAGADAVAPDAAVSEAGAEAGETGMAAAVTYYQHVAPILATECVVCHSPGGIGPFALDTAAAAQTYAPLIKIATRMGDMPPWPPGPLSPPLKHERRLTADEVALLAAWADAGAPLGDPGEAGTGGAAQLGGHRDRRHGPEHRRRLRARQRAHRRLPLLPGGHRHDGEPHDHRLSHHPRQQEDRPPRDHLPVRPDRQGGAAGAGRPESGPGGVALRGRAGPHRQRPDRRRLAGIVGARGLVGGVAPRHRHRLPLGRPGGGPGSLQLARGQGSRPHAHRGEAGAPGDRGPAAAAGHRAACSSACWSCPPTRAASCRRAPAAPSCGRATSSTPTATRRWWRWPGTCTPWARASPSSARTPRAPPCYWTSPTGTFTGRGRTS